MELVEGQTLRELLKAGPLTIADAVRYGGQIADALVRTVGGSWCELSMEVGGSSFFNTGRSVARLISHAAPALSSERLADFETSRPA